MITHDTLAFAVATEAVRRIREEDSDWAEVLSPNVYSTSSRSWPVPDFVIVDRERNVTAAAEFKPPRQTKREYLTGLGQALSYTKDFHYALLIVPDVSDDGYNIAWHIQQVLDQQIAGPLPVALLKYESRKISPASAPFEVLRPLSYRGTSPVSRGDIESSFWTKWRDVSPGELGRFLELLYEEGRRHGADGTVRDRAFDRLWEEMVAGKTLHWGGGPRKIDAAHRVAWGKNYRNFIAHLGWVTGEGRLTESGLAALHIAHQYDTGSRLFLDHIAQATLLEGRHLVLINAINRFQDSTGTFDDEHAWLDSVERHLDEEGLLDRNPGRHAAAVRGVTRGFLKAEKTLWRRLELIVPRRTRVYHPGRGFVFNWARITSILSA